MNEKDAFRLTVILPQVGESFNLNSVLRAVKGVCDSGISFVFVLADMPRRQIECVEDAALHDERITVLVSAAASYDELALEGVMVAEGQTVVLSDFILLETIGDMAEITMPILADLGRGSAECSCIEFGLQIPITAIYAYEKSYCARQLKQIATTLRYPVLTPSAVNRIVSMNADDIVMSQFSDWRDSEKDSYKLQMCTKAFSDLKDALGDAYTGDSLEIYGAIVSDILLERELHIRSLVRQNSDLVGEVRSLGEDLSQAKKELKKVRSSKSFTVGKAITSIPRKFKKVLASHGSTGARG